MSNSFILAAALATWIFLITAFSYFMAYAGHPVAVWLWRDILEVMS